MKLKRYLGIAAFFLALFAGAATAADRSPFVQGHWWNPARAGNGFDFFNVDDRAMIIWYTYEESGRPVWYTAQGSVATMGAAQWPILRHRWANGVKVPGVVVGSMRIALGGYESATLSWNIGGSAGSWPIVPFRPSALTVIPNPDRTGSWFDPSNSGWGVSLTEQGDVFGGVLFTYDTAGEPTWAAGFDRVRQVADLHTFEGACPSCAYHASVSRPVGRVTFDFIGDTQAVIHNQLTLPMAAGTNIDGATIVQLGRPASTRPADRPEPAPQGSLFSFVEANGVGAPNSDAQLSVQRTGATSGAFDIYYTFEGAGCARSGTGGPVRFGEGDMGSKPVSVPMGVKGVCVVWLVPPPAPAGIGDQYAAGITVVPVVAGCPAPSNVVYAELGEAGNAVRYAQRSGQTLFMPLPAPPGGRASGQVVVGENASSPQPVMLEISINRCPGIIDTDTSNRCNIRSSNGSFNSVTAFTRPYGTITSTATASAHGYCWAGDGGIYYVNVRWTYEHCPLDAADCGFTIQYNKGPY